MKSKQPSFLLFPLNNLNFEERKGLILGLVITNLFTTNVGTDIELSFRNDYSIISS